MSSQPRRYALYSSFSDSLLTLDISALTADIIRANIATTASGAVIIGDEIKANKILLAEYQGTKNLCDETVENWRRNYAASTVLRMVTELKRHLVITLELENNPAIAILGLNSTDTKAAKQQGIRRGNRTAQHRRPFYDVKGIINTATKLINSRGYLNVITGLVLLTGRRPSEIILTGTLVKTGEYSAIFSGQLKTKKDSRITGKDGGGNDRDEYEIPLLASFNIINAALKKLRAHEKLQKTIDGIRDSEGAMTLPQAVNSRLASNCRKVSRDAFLYRIPDFIDGEKLQPIRQMTTYTLRGVYAKINAMNAGLTDKTDAAYIRDILGHSYEQSLSTSSAYDHCYYAGSKLPKSCMVKKTGVDISELNIDNKKLNIGIVQNAGTGRNIDPVKLSDLYRPQKDTILSKAKKLLNKLAFWN